MFTPKEFTFILENLDKDPYELALKYAKKKDLDYSKMIDQIKARKKAAHKLPELFSKEYIVYPPTKNLEQSSSEITAKYKSEILTGKKGADLTGGFGIDTIYLAKNFEAFSYVEPSSNLVEIAKHNFQILDLKIDVYQESAESFINKSAFLDSVYIDPSRRNLKGEKVVFLEDYSPNIVELQDILLTKAENILIKTSPLLDIKNTMLKLKSLVEIHIISIKNEVKEVLYLLKPNQTSKEVKFYTTNFTSPSSHQIFNFYYKDLENSSAEYSLPQKYIYEPNNAIMKSGAFQLLSAHFKLKKLHKNSHIYTSDTILNEFPGRVFELKKTHSYSKKELKEYKKANITIRNFPESVSQIRKKHKILEGGEIYLFGTTDINDKPIILACTKIDQK